MYPDPDGFKHGHISVPQTKSRLVNRVA